MPSSRTRKTLAPRIPHENQKVGDHLNEAVRCQDQGPGGLPEGENQDEQEGDQRRRQGDGEVDPKFIPHGAALAVAGGDGGVGDKGEVVPKHGPAHDRGHTQGNGEAGGLCHNRAMGVIRVMVPTEVPMASETKQLTTKRTATANWAGTRRQKIGHAVGAAPPHHPHKNAGGEEDENHNDDVFVPTPFPIRRSLSSGKGPGSAGRPPAGLPGRPPQWGCCRSPWGSVNRTQRGCQGPGKGSEKTPMGSSALTLPRFIERTSDFHVSRTGARLVDPGGAPGRLRQTRKSYKKYGEMSRGFPGRAGKPCN